MTYTKPVITLLDTAGATLLELTPASGFRVIDWLPDGKTKRRNTATSAWVDGEFDATTPTDGARTGALSVRVVGSSWPVVEGRVQALLAVFDQPFRLSQLMGGVTTVWSCRPSDAGSSFTRDDAMTGQRIVNATIMMQPNPTVTGVA